MGKLKAAPHRLAMVKPHRMRMPESRQEYDKQRNEQPWRKWYKTTQWRRLRWATLVRDLFTCQICGHVGADKMVADHKQPHRGDEHLFWDANNLQCLCPECHSGAKQRAEQRQW